MGSFDFKLGELMGSINQTLSHELIYKGKKMGTVIIHADKVAK